MSIVSVPPGGEMHEAEPSFRRGYQQGASAAVQALLKGAGLEQLHYWVYFALFEWRLSPVLPRTLPPPAPTSRYGDAGVVATQTEGEFSSLGSLSTELTPALAEPV